MKTANRRRLATLTAAAALLGGGAVIAAPSASAVGSSACRYNITPDIHKLLIDGLNFRTGPGTNYLAKGLLYKGDKYVPRCGVRVNNKAWIYVKLTQRSKSGLRAGTWGWVRAGHTISPA
ncbi:hypothetical protein OG440_38700 (plasmid) [Streptomyces sp. NBC_00637]|uniref:hypothetical protein n=1 Tax=Streptomyces sp. NBC_00637 TaxID=2903667 RepID=UPI002F917C56